MKNWFEWIPAFAGMTVPRLGMTVPRPGMTVPRSGWIPAFAGMTVSRLGMTEGQPGMTRAVSSGVTNVKARHTCGSRNPILMFRNGLSFQRKKACHSCESRNPKDMKNWFGWIPAFAGMTMPWPAAIHRSGWIDMKNWFEWIPAFAGMTMPRLGMTVHWPAAIHRLHTGQAGRGM